MSRLKLFQPNGLCYCTNILFQIGMFAYTGLTAEQMTKLAEEHSVYATKDGRISVAGITTGNVKRLAESIYKITG